MRAEIPVRSPEAFVQLIANPMEKAGMILNLPKP